MNIKKIIKENKWCLIIGTIWGLLATIIDNIIYPGFNYFLIVSRNIDISSMKGFIISRTLFLPSFLSMYLLEFIYEKLSIIPYPTLYNIFFFVLPSIFLGIFFCYIAKKVIMKLKRTKNEELVI